VRVAAGILPLGADLELPHRDGIRKTMPAGQDARLYGRQTLTVGGRRLPPKCTWGGEGNVLAQAGRADVRGQTARLNPALPAANCWVFSFPELPPSFPGAFMPKVLEGSYENRVVLETGGVSKPGVLEGSAKSGAIDHGQNLLGVI
jgi:hypothetical protein